MYMHYQPNGHEFEQTLGESEGQGSLVCCSPWGLRVKYDLATEQQDIVKMEYSKNAPFYLSLFLKFVWLC